MVVTPPSSLLQPSVIITDSYSGVDFDADVYVDLDANFEVVVDVNVDVNADVDVGGLPSQPQPSVTPPRSPAPRSVTITDFDSGVDFDDDIDVDLDVVVDVNIDVNVDFDVDGGLPSQPQPSVTPPPLTCSTLSIFPHVNACSSTSTK